MATTTQQLERSGRLAKNQIRGIKVGRMFGHRFNISAFSNVVFWDGPTDDYIFTDPALNRIDTISSADASDNGQVYIEGLDENWMQVSQIVTLNGQNKVSLTVDLIRFNFAQSLKNLNGDVYVYEDTAVTSGVPNDLTKVKGYIDAYNNISRQLIVSVPVNYDINVKRVEIYASPGVQCCMSIELWTKYFGQADIMGYKTPISYGGTTFVPMVVVSTALFPEKSDLYAKVTTTNPGSSVTSIVEYEFIKS